MTALDTRRAEMARLRDEIESCCRDVRDGVLAGWCAAALHLYGIQGLTLLAEEAAERGDWPEHRRLTDRLIEARREGGQP